MKTFNKTELPESIDYANKTYTLNVNISSAMRLNNTSINAISATLKKENRLAVLVKVLHKNLKGKTDLHGNPYKPTEWIYTTN